MSGSSRTFKIGARVFEQKTMSSDEDSNEEAFYSLDFLGDYSVINHMIAVAEQVARATLLRLEVNYQAGMEPQEEEGLSEKPAAFWACCLLKQAGYLQVADGRVRAALPTPKGSHPTASGETLRAFDAALAAAMLVGVHFGRLEELTQAVHGGRTMDELVEASLRQRAKEGFGGKKGGETRRQDYPKLLAAAQALRLANPHASDDWIARTLFERFAKPSVERIVSLLRTWRKEGLLPCKARKAR